jgi:hypothetical protein
VAAHTEQTARAGTITVTPASGYGFQPVLIAINQDGAPVAGDPITILSATTIDAEPAIATAIDSKTSYAITFNATKSWTAAVVGTPWFHIDGATSGAVGSNQTLTIVVDYFKGDDNENSKVRFTANSQDFDVTVKDNYAAAAVVHAGSGKTWAPTDVANPGQFAPVIKLPGKAYQWGRNIPYTTSINWVAGTGSVTFPDGITAWPGNAAVTYDGVSYPAYTGGQSWDNTPCPAGWSMPDYTTVYALLGTAGSMETAPVKVWTNSNASGLYFPAAGQIQESDGQINKPGSGNFRYAMWANNERSDNGAYAKFRRMDSNNTENSNKHAGNYVRCFKN